MSRRRNFWKTFTRFFFGSRQENQAKRTPRPVSRRAIGIEKLEDRVTPAVFAYDAGTNTLTLTLDDALSEQAVGDQAGTPTTNQVSFTGASFTTTGLASGIVVSGGNSTNPVLKFNDSTNPVEIFNVVGVGSNDSFTFGSGYDAPAAAVSLNSVLSAVNFNNASVTNLLAFTSSAPVSLLQATSIQTATGGSIVFNSTINGAFNLSLAAVGTGDIDFNNTIGTSQGSANRPAIVITDADAVDLDANAYVTAFTIKDTTLEGAATFDSTGFTINTTNAPSGSTSGAVDILTTGTLTVGSISTAGTSVTTAPGINAGAVTLVVTSASSNINLTGTLDLSGGAASGTVTNNGGNAGVLTMSAGSTGAYTLSGNINAIGGAASGTTLGTVGISQPISFNRTVDVSGTRQIRGLSAAFASTITQTVTSTLDLGTVNTTFADNVTIGSLIGTGTLTVTATGKIINSTTSTSTLVLDTGLAALSLGGAGAMNMVGNISNNILTGNSANNIITLAAGFGYDQVDGGANTGTTGNIAVFPAAQSAYTFSFTSDGRYRVSDGTNTALLTNIQNMRFGSSTTNVEVPANSNLTGVYDPITGILTYTAATANTGNLAILVNNDGSVSHITGAVTSSITPTKIVFAGTGSIPVVTITEQAGQTSGYLSTWTSLDFGTTQVKTLVFDAILAGRTTTTLYTTGAVTATATTVTVPNTASGPKFQQGDLIQVNLNYNTSVTGVNGNWTVTSVNTTDNTITFTPAAGFSVPASTSITAGVSPNLSNIVKVGIIQGTINPVTLGSNAVTISNSNVTLSSLYGPGITIYAEGNRLTGVDDTGILVDATRGTLTNVLIDGVTITDNDTTLQNGIGVRVIGGSAGNLQVTNSVFAGLNMGVKVESTGSVSTSVNNIGYSDLSSTFMGIVNLSATGIAARGNYWGTTSSDTSAIADKVSINYTGTLGNSQLSNLSPRPGGSNATVGYRSESYRSVNDLGRTVGESGTTSGSQGGFFGINVSNNVVSRMDLETGISGLTTGMVGANSNTTGAVYDVNNAGTISGVMLRSYGGTVGNAFTLFRDPSTGDTQYLSDVQLGQFTVLANRNQMNASGIVAATVFNKQSGQGYSVPVRWNGTTVTVLSPANGSTAVVNPFGVGSGIGINDTGDVVATFFDSATNTFRPMKFVGTSQFGNFMTISGLSSGNTQVADIDNSGRVLGSLDTVVSGAIGTLPWVTNATGTSVGQQWTNGLLKAGGGDWLYNYPMSMNENGFAVGFSADTQAQPYSWANNTNKFVTDAWIWDSTTSTPVPVNLQTMLSPTENALYDLTSATDINNNNQATVNYKFKSDFTVGQGYVINSVSPGDLGGLVLNVTAPTDGRIGFQVGQQFTVNTGTITYTIGLVTLNANGSYSLEVDTSATIVATDRLILTYGSSPSYSMLMNVNSTSAPTDLVDYSSFFGSVNGSNGTVVGTRFFPNQTALGTAASGPYYGALANRLTDAAQNFASTDPYTTNTTLKVNNGDYTTAYSVVSINPSSATAATMTVSSGTATAMGTSPRVYISGNSSVPDGVYNLTSATSTTFTFSGSSFITGSVLGGNIAVYAAVAPLVALPITIDATASNIVGIQQWTYGLGNSGTNGILNTTFLGANLLNAVAAPFTTVAGVNSNLGMNVARYPSTTQNGIRISDEAGVLQAYNATSFQYTGTAGGATTGLVVGDTLSWPQSIGTGTFNLSQTALAATPTDGNTVVSYNFAGNVPSYFLTRAVSMVRTVAGTPATVTTFSGTITAITLSGLNTTLQVTYSVAPGAGTTNSDNVTLSAPTLNLTSVGEIQLGTTTSVLVAQAGTYGDLNAATGALALLPTTQTGVVLMNASSPVELGSGPVVVDRSVTFRGSTIAGNTQTAINYPGDITVQGSIGGGGTGSGSTNGTLISSAGVPLFIGAIGSPARLIINPGATPTSPNQGGSLINNVTSLYGPYTSDLFLQSVTGGFVYGGDTVSLSTLTQSLYAAGVTSPTVNIFAASGVTVSALNMQRNQIGSTTTYVNDHVVPTNTSNTNFVTLVNVQTSNQNLLTDALALVKTSGGTVNLAVNNTGTNPSPNYGVMNISTPVTFTSTAAITRIDPISSTAALLTLATDLGQSATVYISNNSAVPDHSYVLGSRTGSGPFTYSFTGTGFSLAGGVNGGNLVVTSPAATATRVNLSGTGVVSQASSVFTSNDVRVTAAAGTTTAVTTPNGNLVGSAQTVAATVASVPATVTFSNGTYSATSATFTAQANQNNITIATGSTVNGVLNLQIGAASTGLANPFTINLTGSSAINMAGAGSGAFILNANASNNALTGSSGNDTLNGQAGINTLFGLGGIDTAYNNGTLGLLYTNNSVANQVISVSGTGTNNLPMAPYTITSISAASATRTPDNSAVTLTVGSNSFQVGDRVVVSGYTTNGVNYNTGDAGAVVTSVSSSTINYGLSATALATVPAANASFVTTTKRLVVGSTVTAQLTAGSSKITVTGFTGNTDFNVYDATVTFIGGAGATAFLEYTAVGTSPSAPTGTGSVTLLTVSGTGSAVTNSGVVDVERIANFATNNTTPLSVSATQGTAITSIQANSATAATLISPTSLGSAPTVYISGNSRVPSGNYTLTGAGTGTAPFTYTFAATGLTNGTTNGGSAWVNTTTSYTYALDSSAGAFANIPTVTLTREGVPYNVPVTGTTTVSPFTITLNITGITGLTGTAPQSSDTIVANNLPNKLYGLAGALNSPSFSNAQVNANGTTATGGTNGVIVTGLNWAGSAVTTGVSSVAGSGNTVVTMSSIPSGLVVNSYVVLGLTAGTPASRQVLSISGTTFTVANIGSATAMVNTVTPSSQMNVTTDGLDIWAIDGPRANNFSGTAASFYLTMDTTALAMSVNNDLNSTQMVVLGNASPNTITVADTNDYLFIDGASGDDVVQISNSSPTWLNSLTYDAASNRYQYGNVYLSNVERISNPAANSVVALVSSNTYTQINTAVAALEGNTAYDTYTRSVFVPYSATAYSSVTFTKATNLYLYAGTGSGFSTITDVIFNAAGTTSVYNASGLAAVTVGITPTVTIGATSTAITLQKANDLNSTVVAVTAWTSRLSTDTGTAAQITLTVADTTPIAVNDWITLAGTTANLNGTFQVVSVPNSTTFTVAPTAGTAITASAVGYTGATALESSRMGTVSITNNSAVSTPGGISVSGALVTIPNPGDVFAAGQTILVNLLATAPATISGVNGTWVVATINTTDHTLTYTASAPSVTGTTPLVTGTVTRIKDIGTATIDRSLSVSASGGVANTTRVNAVAGTGIMVDRSTGGSLNATISGLRFDATTGKAFSVTDTGTTATGGGLATSRNVVTGSNNVFYTPAASTAVESGASEPGVSAITGNTFFNGLNGALLTSNYDINDRMLHRMSDAGSTYGLVVWNASNLYVSSGTLSNTTAPLARAVGANFAGGQVPTSLLPASYTVNIENTFDATAPTVYTIGTNNLTIVGDATLPATTTKNYSFAFTATGVTGLTVGGQASFNVTGSAANDTITVATLGGNHTFIGNGGTDNIRYPGTGVSANPATFYTQSTAAGTAGTTNILQNYTLSATSVTDTFVGISTIGYQTSPATGVIFVDSSTGTGTISTIKTIEAGVTVSNPGDTIFIRGFPPTVVDFYANTIVNKDNLFMTFNQGISEPGLTPVNLTLAASLALNITIRDGVGAGNYSAVNVIGNDSGNIITGNSGANIITLGKGSDTIVGGLGIDTVILPLSNVNSVGVGPAINGVITLTYNDGVTTFNTTISGVEALQDLSGGKMAIVTGTNTSTSGGYIADWGSTNPYSTYTNFSAVGGSYASNIPVTSASTTISPIVQNAVLSGASRLGTTITGSTTVIASYTAASPVSYGVGDTIVISGYSGADAIFNGTYSVASVAIDKLSFTVSQNVTGPTSAYTAVAGAGNSAISATFASITLTGAGLVNSAAIAGMAGKVATVTIAGSSAANTLALNNALLLVRETSGTSTGQITFNNSVAIPYAAAVVNKDLTFQNSGTAPTVASVSFSKSGAAPMVSFTGSTPFTSSTVTLGTQTVATITAAIISSNVATITAASHGYNTGDSVVIQGVNDIFNGTYTVTVVDINNFTYTKTSADVTLTGLAGKTSNSLNSSIFPNAFAVVVGSSVISPAVRTLTIGSDYVYTSALTLSNNIQYNAGASDRVISNLTLNSASTLAKASVAGVGNLYASSVNLASGGSLSAAMTLLGTSSGRSLTIGAGTYTPVIGGITVSSGQTLTINGAVNLGATPITVATGGNLVVSTSASLTTTGALSVDGTLSSLGSVSSGGLTVAGIMTSSGPVNGGATIITGTGSLSATGGLTTIGLTLGATGTLTTSSITATGLLVFNNSVTNPGVISASTTSISVAAGKTLSTNANITTYGIAIPSTAILLLTGSATVTTDPSGGLSLDGVGDGTSTSGALVVSGTGTITPTIAGPVSTTSGTKLFVDTADTVTFSGVLTTAGQLNKTGPGRLTLGAAGVNSAEVVIIAGQIRMNNVAALGTGSPTITVQSGATLELGAQGVYPYTLNLVGGASTTVASSVKRVDSTAGLTELTGAITLGTAGASGNTTVLLENANATASSPLQYSLVTPANSNVSISTAIVTSSSPVQFFNGITAVAAPRFSTTGAMSNGFTFGQGTAAVDGTVMDYGTGTVAVNQRSQVSSLRVVFDRAVRAEGSNWLNAISLFNVSGSGSTAGQVTIAVSSAASSATQTILDVSWGGASLVNGIYSLKVNSDKLYDTQSRLRLDIAVGTGATAGTGGVVYDQSRVIGALRNGVPGTAAVASQNLTGNGNAGGRVTWYEFQRYQGDANGDGIVSGTVTSTGTPGVPSDVATAYTINGVASYSDGSFYANGTGAAYTVVFGGLTIADFNAIVAACTASGNKPFGTANYSGF